MKPLLILQSTTNPNFVLDERLLREKYPCKSFKVHLKPRIRVVLNQIHLLLWLLWNLPRAHGVFFKFADYYGLFPALLCSIWRKPLWIVVDGYDAYHIPAIGYGVWHKPWRAAVVRYVVSKATLLPTDGSLVWGAGGPSYQTNIEVRCGMSRFSNPSRCIPIASGFDDINPGGTGVMPSASERPIDVLWVIAAHPWQTVEHVQRLYARKGLGIVRGVAERMPDKRFQFVGVRLSIGMQPFSSNVGFAPMVSKNTLRDLYLHSKVFVLPSLAEGMNICLAEAMQCGCVPVVSELPPLMQMVAPYDEVASSHNVDVWAEHVASVLDGIERMDQQALRTHILRNFSVEQRQKNLCDVIGGNA